MTAFELKSPTSQIEREIQAVLKEIGCFTVWFDKMTYLI